MSYFNSHTDSVGQFSQINTWITGSEKANSSRELQCENLTTQTSFHLLLLPHISEKKVERRKYDQSLLV